MYIFCNIMILFSSFANIIIGKFIEGRAKINFYEVRNEKMEKERKKGMFCVYCICIYKTCHENGNKSCFRKNLKVNFCQAFVDIVNTESSVDICSKLLAENF